MGSLRCAPQRLRREGKEDTKLQSYRKSEKREERKKGERKRREKERERKKETCGLADSYIHK